MNRFRLFIVVIIVVGLIFAAQCLYIVKPYESVVQLRFGRMVDPCRIFSGSNLYLKWPSFIDRYVPIDRRLQTTDTVLETINTSGRQDQNFQISAACSSFWRVADAKKFYTSLLSQYRDTVPEEGNSYPAKVNDQIRSIIRSSVNSVFAEARFADLFNLPEFAGLINRDCLALDGNTFLPKGLEIRGGEIRRTNEVEFNVLGPDGKVISLDAAQRQPTPCIVIVLYGYDRESARTSAAEAAQGQSSYSWVVRPDPTAAEGIGRKELTLAIPLKYISDQKTTTTVRIDQIQEKITDLVNKQTLADYGVEVAQVGIRRLSFPASGLQNVYDKMRSERERISRAYISSGERDAKIILSNAQLEASKGLALAQGRARALKGQAEATAAEIAAKVQQLDPEFYNWLQSLETSAEILKNKAWVVLSTDQPVIEALLGQTPKAAPKPADSAEKGQ